MKLFEAIKKASDILRDKGTPQLDAEVILSNLLEKDRIFLYLNRDMPLDGVVVDEFFKRIERRKKGEPVQYITGRQEFMSLDFKVKPGVLIPRGDTEVLVEEVLKAIEGFEKPIVVDVGCGSGAISVSIAKYKEDALVYALDIMDTPLEVTEENAKFNGVSDRVKVLKSDKLAGFDTTLHGKVDVIVSNPPYIRENTIQTLMEEVKSFEPLEALSGGEDGLYFYREITRDAPKLLKAGGLLAYEIGHDQREEVMEILKINGFGNVTCIKDLAGKDRVVMGWRGKYAF